jgi:hypothetical protein
MPIRAVHKINDFMAGLLKKAVAATIRFAGFGSGKDMRSSHNAAAPGFPVGADNRGRICNIAQARKCWVSEGS